MAENLRQIDAARGFWCATAHPLIIDAAASVRPDFICIDTQHGQSLASLDASLFTVMAHYGVASLVRVEGIDRAFIGRALDLGANGIVVPQVDDADEAERVVAATRHAPRGDRSFGMQTRRIGPFDQIPYVVIQVETAGAVDDIDRIAAVDGVDCLYIGPADLGLALGGAAASDVNTVLDGTAPNADELVEVFKSVIEAGRRNRVATGVHCGDGATAKRAFDLGFTFAAITADTSLITRGLAQELEEATRS